MAYFCSFYSYNESEANTSSPSQSRTLVPPAVFPAYLLLKILSPSHYAYISKLRNASGSVQAELPVWPIAVFLLRYLFSVLFFVCVFYYFLFDFICFIFFLHVLQIFIYITSVRWLACSSAVFFIFSTLSRSMYL